MRHRILVTGSAGLVGSQAVRHFAAQGHALVGLDGNQRADFFGPAGDVRANLARLREDVPALEQHALDVRDRAGLARLVARTRPTAVIHAAAQPSHDLARARPFDDFETNALGTLNLLEALRVHAPDAAFVLLSTNKVYGDAPNEIPRIELARRFEYARAEDWHGVDESCRIDRSKHSLFGVSKAAADLLTQEYGRYFGLPTVAFRCGCITGPAHAGVELHGFLSHLVKHAVAGRVYPIHGFGGKQVRDQLHASDLCSAIEHWLEDPRPACVYNLGGGRRSHGSLLECLDLVGELLGRRVERALAGPEREGDHACYVSDLRLFRAEHPRWELEHSLPRILEELVRCELARARGHVLARGA